MRTTAFIAAEVLVLVEVANHTPWWVLGLSCWFAFILAGFVLFNWQRHV